MATVSKPFVNASISPLKRALSWCPLSPTKIALVYVATTGGSPRYFVQIVNFVDGVPVYGPPCLILLQSATNTAPSMRIVSVGPGRLLFSVPKAVSIQAIKSSFVLCKLNNDDTVEFLAESTDLVTANPANGNWGCVPSLLGSQDGTANVYGNVSGVSNSGQPTYWTLNCAGDTVAIGAAQTQSLSNPTAPAAFESIIRTALDGKQWSMQTPMSPWVWIGQRDGNAANDRANLGGTVSSTYAALINGLLPVRDDTFLLFNGLTAQLRQLTRSSGAINSTDPAVLATINWRNAAEYAAGKVEDSIWLDADGTFVSAYTTGTPIAPTDAGSSAETATTVAPLKLHIARYIEATQSIQQAADFPLDLNVNMPKRNWDRMLHRVDSKTLAVIGAFAPAGQFSVQHGIIMVKGD